jgi:hypothetical protein
MDDLVRPSWQDGSSLLVSPWLIVPGSVLQFIVDAWGRCQLGGEIYFPGGNPPEDSVMLQCSSGTAPAHDVSLVAVEDVVPARFYRIDVRSDGSIHLRFANRVTTGQVFLDSLSWIVS